jgi:PAS domain S-box-containing protein
MTDTAVDVLCELNDQGHVVYVSPSVEELLGYSPEQVTGSHFSLWLPADCRDDAKKRFRAYISEPAEHAITLERLKLHTDSGGPIVGEISLRSYRTPQGELRLVGILRDETDRSARISRVKTQVEGDGLNALRSTVEELRHSDSEHPIQRSLAVLLAALESNPTDHEGHVSDSMVAATDRMTRIVESAMIPTRDPSLSFRWLETKKLLDMVHFEFRGIRNTSELELQIDVSNAPTLVWGEEALLAVALGSLFDWATERVRGPAEINLRVETAGDPMSNDAVVVFSVSSSSSTSDGQPVDSERNEDDSAFEARANLALATAEDAACALGGNLDHPEESAGRPVLRICLPQPLRG